MSKSRLEKFLYALYSLDSSDLPTPLSRIEELYKCWVTGEEAPTFEPLSRVEKYLMAILGVYDVNELPNPLSRVEVLLYKLATGDDNLDDVKEFLSEHEELLAEIIRNGGAGGNIDIEYVLYTLSTELNTLYNTAEKPVKSAILKGRTLVNLIPNTTISWACANSSAWLYKYVELNQQLKPNTIYTIIANVLETNGDGTVSLTIGGKTGAAFQPKNVGIKKGRNVFTAETYSDGQGNLNLVFFQIQDNYVGNFTLNDFIILEGDHSNEDIPYFEGMQSVKMPVLKTTGKNLFDINSISNINNWDTVVSGVIPYCSYKINLKPNTTYTFSQKQFLHIEDVYACFGLKKGGYEALLAITHPTSKNSTTFKLTTDDRGLIYVKLYRANTTLETFISKLSNNQLQLEESSTATSYEPYKSNILTVNEPIELRGIGDVRDELNLLTGELTQRVGEIVLDGSESWIEDTNGAGVRRYFLMGVGDDLSVDIANSSTLLCDKFTVGSSIWTETNDSVHIIKSNGIYFIDSSVDSLDAFVNKLKTSNIKVQYSLIEKPVKTVDLSVVDQDGNNTELKTFNDITHVTLSSEGLIPEAEMEVATKNEEDLEDSVVYAVHTLSEELNTLYNTAEKPVKSAILKGSTLVNLSNISSSDIISINNISLDTSLRFKLKNLTTYTAIFNVVTLESPNDAWCGFMGNNGWGSDGKTYKIGINKIAFTTLENSDCGKFRLRGINNAFKNLIILEGDYTNVDIPYFDGMQSVKMPVLTTSNEDGTKTNILTVNEEVELRGIDDVKDELNLLTGGVIKKLGKVTFNGSENWQDADNALSNTHRFQANLSTFKNGSILLNDGGFNNITTGTSHIDTKHIQISGKYIFIRTLRSEIDSLDDFKSFLSSNPLTIIGELDVGTASETVDLSVADQDGNNTKLSTFDDITHVTLSSEGLIPEAELEVAEKVPEVAANMLGISREQEVINTATNEQSENVDATMIATTEIYEGLL